MKNEQLRSWGFLQTFLAIAFHERCQVGTHPLTIFYIALPPANIMELYVGCSGWSYNGWSGHFYPKNMESSNYLEHYARVFDFAEIDSTFHKIPPDRFTAIRWNKLTPDNFRFTAKIPGAITHQKRLASASLPDLEHFFDVMRPLKDKMLALLIQLPPSLVAEEGLGRLEKILSVLDRDFNYAIEFRHKSWFAKDVYKLLSAFNVCLTWSLLDAIHTPPELTADFIYLRLIGDKTKDETEVGMVRKEKSKEMMIWAMKVKNAKNVNFGIVAANDKYAGFAPATAKSFRKMVGLRDVSWEEIK